MVSISTAHWDHQCCLRNPGYTDSFSTAGTYTHTLEPINDSICHFRLDFVEFEIVKPTSGTGTDGACPTDTITVKEVKSFSKFPYLKYFSGFREDHQHSEVSSSVLWYWHRSAHVPPGSPWGECEGEHWYCSGSSQHWRQEVEHQSYSGNIDTIQYN